MAIFLPPSGCKEEGSTRTRDRALLQLELLDRAVVGVVLRGKIWTKRRGVGC